MGDHETGFYIDNTKKVAVPIYVFRGNIYEPSTTHAFQRNNYLLENEFTHFENDCIFLTIDQSLAMLLLMENTVFSVICGTGRKICVGKYNKDEGVILTNNRHLRNRAVITESIIPPQELYNDLQLLASKILYEFTFNHKSLWNLR